jgi:hypothetical protein
VRTSALILIAVVALPGAAAAQARRAPARRPPAAKAAPQKTEPAMMMCPEVLGQGVQTKQTFCDVLIGRDPAGGIIITLPPHVGPVTLSFDLHNRHTYSEELVREHKAYSRYTATIGVLTLDNTLLTRAIIQTEFRTPADLVDRIAGGTGPGGVKAVAPIGTESISVAIPQGENAVSILGEKLTVLRDPTTQDGVDNFSAAGRPIALISNVTVTYRPAPPRRAPAPRPRKR